MIAGSSAATAVRTRKTQAERSAETRALLLDATIESLIEVGYGAMSTTDVVRRAGVSRGAQVHQLARKLDLVQAAIRHLALKGGQELDAAMAKLPDDGSRAYAALELLWRTYEGPFFWAAIELVVAGRTDQELQPALTKLHETIGETMHEFYVHLFGPGAVGNIRLHEMVELSIQFMNGLALVKPGKGEQWCRQQLELWVRTVRPLVKEALMNPSPAR